MVNDVMFEIKEHVGVLKEYPNGWKRELNVVVWNGAEPRFDIRDWDPEHQYMSRGITLTSDEMISLCLAVAERAGVIE